MEPIKVRIYWDDKDPSWVGWAYESDNIDGSSESGALDSTNISDMDDPGFLKKCEAEIRPYFDRDIEVYLDD